MDAGCNDSADGRDGVIAVEVAPFLLSGTVGGGGGGGPGAGVGAAIIIL